MFHKPKSFFSLVALSVLSLAACHSAQAQGLTFTYSLFDPTAPAGGYPPGGNSGAYGISNNGTVVGTALGSDGITWHGYTYQNGVSTTYHYPGEQAGSFAQLISSNNSGVLTGFYSDAAGNGTNFIDNNGSIISPQHANAPNGTFYAKVNDAGLVAGSYADAANINHGTIYNVNTGTFTDLPDESPYGTFPQQIAMDGDMAVSYDDAAGNEHGGVLHNGVYTSLTFPGMSDTRTNGINDNGLVTGRYFDGSTFHGFAYLDNDWYSLDVPGAIETDLYSVNDSNQIAGFYVDQSGTFHSVVVQATATPEPGSIALLIAGGVTATTTLLRRRRKRRLAS